MCVGSTQALAYLLGKATCTRAVSYWDPFYAECVWAAGYERLYREAAQRLEQLGGVPVPIDFEPFATVAGLLYTSAFLAERYSGVRAFLEAGQVRCPHMRSASRMHANQRTTLDMEHTRSNPNMMAHATFLCASCCN